MKKIIIGLFAVLILTSFSSPKHNEVVKCYRQVQQLKVDGKANDWVNALSTDEKTGFNYSFSNDNDFLYVCMKISNAKMQRKVIATGLTLWIDPSGKGKDKLGILFPQGRTRNNSDRNRDWSQRRRMGNRPHKSYTTANRAEMIKKFNLRYLSGAETGELIGFAKEGMKDAFIGKNGIDVMVQLNAEGQLVYEAKIPLNMIFNQKQKYFSATPKIFSLAFETGYIKIDMSHMGGGGMNRMGSGNMRSEGMSRQGSMNSDSDMQFMTSSSKIKWKKVILNNGK